MVFNPCHHYHILLRRMSRRMAEREQSAQDAIVRGRGAVPGPAFLHYSGRQSSLPSAVASGSFFAFPPSPRELSKNTGHTEQAQQAGSFPFTFLCLLEAKVVPCLWPKVHWGCFFSLGADVVQDWLLCPFLWGECGFVFSCGNEPRPLVLGAHKLILNFLSLRRTL